MQKAITIGAGIAALILLGAGCAKTPDNTIPVGQTMPTSVVPLDDEPVVVTADEVAATTTLVKPARALPSVSTTKTITPPVGKAAPKSYTDDLKTYRSKGAYMLLLACHGQPGVISMKRGVKFMIDNQDTKPHTVSIGKIFVYRIAARGYTIAAAPNAAGQYYLTCDGGGAALINVEG